VTAALAKTADRETRAHLEGARDRISKILDPKFAPPAASAVTLPRIGIEEGCWPDTIVLP
jgi:hypothetical protein